MLIQTKFLSHYHREWPVIVFENQGSALNPRHPSKSNARILQLPLYLGKYGTADELQL